MKLTQFCARTATILVAGGALLLAIWALADICYLLFGIFPTYSSEPSTYQTIGRTKSFVVSAAIAYFLRLLTQGLWKSKSWACAITLMLSGALLIFCLMTLGNIGLDSFGAWPFTIYCLSIFVLLIIASSEFGGDDSADTESELP